MKTYNDKDLEIKGDILIRCTSTDREVIIPGGIRKISDNAFYNCINLTSIIIPDSVTEIGNWAFKGCSNLISVIIGDSVIKIGDHAFAYCNNLTSVTMGNSVTKIEDYAFIYCSNLISIDLPDSVTEIGNYAFSDCYELTSINIPKKVMKIGNFAFSECCKLTSIKIPNSVKTIEASAFKGCTNLTSIIVEEKNSRYDSRDNCNAIIKTATDTLIIGCANTVIPNSVKIIGVGAFAGCSRLTSIRIPDSVISIDKYAFYGCTELNSIDIPDSVTEIYFEAFTGTKIKYKPQGNIAYKGFNADMTCRDFKYQEGETYTCNKASLCECGFHACLNPLDCINYYCGDNVIFHEVMLEDRTDEWNDEDSKICGRKITIGRRLTFKEMAEIFNKLNNEYL